MNTIKEECKEPAKGTCKNLAEVCKSPWLLSPSNHSDLFLKKKGGKVVLVVQRLTSGT